MAAAHIKITKNGKTVRIFGGNLSVVRWHFNSYKKMKSKEFASFHGDGNFLVEFKKTLTKKVKASFRIKTKY